AWGPGAPPAPPGPPALVQSAPLTEEELTQVLATLRSNNIPLVNQALLRLLNAKPLDQQRERVAKALEPLTGANGFGIDTNAVKALGVWGTRDSVPLLLNLINSTNVFVRPEAIRALG